MKKKKWKDKETLGTAKYPVKLSLDEMAVTQSCVRKELEAVIQDIIRYSNAESGIYNAKYKKGMIAKLEIEREILQDICNELKQVINKALNPMWMP